MGPLSHCWQQSSPDLQPFPGRGRMCQQLKVAPAQCWGSGPLSSVSAAVCPVHQAMLDPHVLHVPSVEWEHPLMNRCGADAAMMTNSLKVELGRGPGRASSPHNPTPQASTG